MWDGRQLASLVLVGSYGPVYKIDFEYNDQGYRTAKIKSAWVNYAWSQTERIDYELIDDKVIYESNGTYGLLFSYDYDGKIISFNGDLNVNDTTPGQEYFYLRNQQGDITTIVDEDGLAIVKYRYDAYGNTTVVSDLSEGIVSFYNPYTYRGYRFDSEIGMYYLNSRYYNPQIGRFINADGITGGLRGVSSTNSFAYCGNNPISRIDPNGNEWWNPFSWSEETQLKVMSGCIIALGVIAACIPGGQMVGAILIGAGAGSLVGGEIAKSNGGDYRAGWLGGLIAGAIIGAGMPIAAQLFTVAATTTYSAFGAWVNAFAFSALLGGTGGFIGSLVKQGVNGTKDIDMAVVEGLISAGLTCVFAPFSLVGVAMITDGYVVSSVIYGLLVELVNDVSSYISSTIHGGSDKEEADYCEE